MVAAQKLEKGLACLEKWMVLTTFSASMFIIVIDTTVIIVSISISISALVMVEIQALKGSASRIANVTAATPSVKAWMSINLSAGSLIRRDRATTTPPTSAVATEL